MPPETGGMVTAYEGQAVAELSGVVLSVGMADTSTSRVACQAS